MDNKTYDKVQETLTEVENRLYQMSKDIGHQPIEKEKVFGFIFIHGDDKGCTTQIVSPAPIAAMMILQLLSDRPEIAQEIKRIQVASFLDAMIPDDDDDESDTQATFSVCLVDVHNDVIGGSKLRVVKFLKESKDLGLKEAADLVNATPCIIFNNLSITEAEKIVNELAKFGAVCEIVKDKKTKVVTCEE